MYITTQEHGIINPDNYPRIDIYPDADTYTLCAFTERDPNQNDPKHRITIAAYNKRVDANYALIHLYRALDMGKETWDSKNVPLLSEMWDEVKHKLSDDQIISYLIKDASLNITPPDMLTIKIPYTRSDENINNKKMSNEEIDSIKYEMNLISDELINVLKQDSIFPIRNFTFNLSTDPLAEK